MMKSFFFHYNKPASKQADKPQISLHFNKTCHVVDNITCYVPTKGKVRTTRQPFFIMTGKYNNIQLHHNNNEVIAEIR